MMRAVPAGGADALHPAERKSDNRVTDGAGGVAAALRVSFISRCV